MPRSAAASGCAASRPLSEVRVCPPVPTATMPPAAPRNAPYMTHLGYVRQRRSPEDGEMLLNEALAKLRGTI